MSLQPGHRAQHIPIAVNKAAEPAAGHGLIQVAHIDNGLLKTIGSLPLMAVDPTLPLQHKIDRSRVSNQHIKIDVQTLLRHLRGDEDMTTLGPALWPEERKDLLLDLQPLTHRKAGMEQDGLGSSKAAKEGLSPRHLVHHHQHPCTLTGPASRLNRQGIEIG